MIAQAVGMFAVTNIDDVVILALLFGKAAGDRRAAVKVVIGQYLGFAGILAISVAGALGVGLLPPAVVPYLGLIPVALGIRAALRGRDEPSAQAPGVWTVAGVTFANGGDNIGVYVPVFAAAGGVTVFVVVFLVLVGVWCVAGWFVATRPVIARALTRGGHVLLPVVLVGVGLLILFRLF
jgi:cadmium resistance protein CadD (predicted permease)